MSTTDSYPCSICGQTTFSWGRVQTKSEDEHLEFHSDGEGFFQHLVGLGHQPVQARRCDRCGNVQLFVEHQ